MNVELVDGRIAECESVVRVICEKMNDLRYYAVLKVGGCGYEYRIPRKEFNRLLGEMNGTGTAKNKKKD